MATSRPSVAPGAADSRLNHFHALRGHGVTRTSVMGMSGGQGLDSPSHAHFFSRRHIRISELSHS